MKRWTVFGVLVILTLLTGTLFQFRSQITAMFVGIPSSETQTSTDTTSNNYGLLAPSISSGALKPQSFLIFNFKSVQDHLMNVIQTNNLDVSMYVQNLRDGNNFAIQENKGAFPASLNKIPVAVLVMNRIEKGELSFDTSITIDKSLLINDSNEIYYENNQLPVKVLFDRMLQESDNTAFGHLLKKINVRDLNSLMTYYDIDAEHSYRYTSESDMENNVLLTPQSFANMFSSLYYSTILNATDSEYILDLLANSTLNMNIIAQLSNNVTVSHKWGYYSNDNASTFNDCGIMYIGSGRILYCVIIRNQTTTFSEGILGGVINNIYEFYRGMSHENSLFKQNLTATTK